MDYGNNENGMSQYARDINTYSNCTMESGHAPTFKYGFYHFLFEIDLNQSGKNGLNIAPFWKKSPQNTIFDT